MNTYRVDRNDSYTQTPCGMNSLIYIGDSLPQATRAFNKAVPGFDEWNRPNNRYGITIAKWNDGKNDYVIFDTKGFK